MFFKVPSCLSRASVLFLLVLSFSSHASNIEDHNQVSRYQGATLKNSGVIHYKSILVPVNVVPQTEETELVEVIGKITAHGYLLDAKKSALEVGLNYKQVAERLGAEVLVDCVDMLCGYQPLDFYWDSWAHINSLAAEDDEDNTRFLVAKKTTEKGDTYYQWIITVDYYGVVGIDQTIIEPEALLLDQVKVNSSVAVAVSQSRVVAERGDIEGSQDHPIISRYQGAYITNYQQREHERVVIPTGVAIDKVTPVIELEGKGTTIGYQLDNSQSTLQIYKNYLAALTNADFDVLFSCSLETCGSDLLYDLYSSGANQHRFSPINRTNYPDSDFRFISAKLATPASAVYLFVAIDGAGTSNDTNKIVVDIVEVSEMNEGKVSIDAQYLNNEISQKGRVVLHGLNFDFNKSTLLPSSTESLTAMVQYLSAHPNQSFYVVGHTDNVGSYDVNTQLSEARAQSVIKALAELKVDKSRLYAVGVGPVSPKTANNSEANQAENRRVELVLM